MELQSLFGLWYLIDGPNGTDVLPAETVGDLSLLVGVTATPATDHWPEIISAVADYIENIPERLTSVQCVNGWGARYSMPGYLDCTRWVLADTEEEALSECRSMYGDEEEEEAEDKSTH